MPAIEIAQAICAARKYSRACGDGDEFASSRAAVGRRRYRSENSVEPSRSSSIGFITCSYVRRLRRLGRHGVSSTPSYKSEGIPEVSASVTELSFCDAPVVAKKSPRDPIRSGRWKSPGVAHLTLWAACSGGADRHLAGAAIDGVRAAPGRGELDGRRGQGRLTGGPIRRLVRTVGSLENGWARRNSRTTEGEYSLARCVRYWTYSNSPPRVRLLCSGDREWSAFG